MNICFITDNPDTARHPVLNRVLERLSGKHSARLLDVVAATTEQALAREQAAGAADIYLLKSHAPQALELARRLEQRRAPVVNSWASSFACRDRVLMTQRMKAARLPWPLTWSVSSPRSAAAELGLKELPFPLMVKSRHSCRGDFVGRIDGPGEWEALARERPREPMILQEFVRGDGSDLKLWVIGREIFAARRPSPLDTDAPKQDCPIPADSLPAAWRSIALEVGRVFGLHLYGVDLLVTSDGPVVVDVNSFPGFRGVPGADAALIGLIERLTEKTANPDSLAAL